MLQNRTVYGILGVAILMVIAQLTNNYMLFAYTMPTMIFGFIFLGSIQRNKLPKFLAIGWVALFVLVLSSLLMMINIVETPADITKELIFGLPKATVILLGVFWALTGILSTAFYALRFDKDILSDEAFDEFKKQIEK